MTAFLNAQTTAGIGKESVYGTGVTPTYSIPWTALTADDVNTVEADNGWRGAPADAYGYSPGPLSGAVPFGGPVYPDTIGFPFAGVLGDVVASGSGPVTWTMACLNSGTQQPSSYTATVVDGVNTRQWPGLKFTGLTLTATADGTLDWAATAVSLASAIVSPPSTSYTSVRMVPAWVGAVSIGGTQVPTCLQSTVKLTRAVEAKRNTDGSQAPYLQRLGLLTVSGSMTLVLLTDSYRALYIAGTPTALNFNYAQGAGSSATQVQVHCSQATFTNVEPSYTTGLYQQVKVDWAASYNTTDVGASGGTSPCKVTLQNAVSSGIY